MLWILLVALGLAVEICVIVVLGQHTTRRDEDEGPAVEPAPQAGERGEPRPDALLHEREVGQD